MFFFIGNFEFIQLRDTPKRLKHAVAAVALAAMQTAAGFVAGASGALAAAFIVILLIHIGNGFPREIIGILALFLLGLVAVFASSVSLLTWFNRLEKARNQIKSGKHRSYYAASFNHSFHYLFTPKVRAKMVEDEEFRASVRSLLAEQRIIDADQKLSIKSVDLEDAVIDAKAKSLIINAVETLTQSVGIQQREHFAHLRKEVRDHLHDKVTFHEVQIAVGKELLEDITFAE